MKVPTFLLKTFPLNPINLTHKKDQTLAKISSIKQIIVQKNPQKTSLYPQT
jgi:hypothetical protein